MAGYTRQQLDAHRAANNLNPTTWASAVLRGLDVRVTPGALQAMVGWAKAEGGHWNNRARYNPLNTTQPEPGAGNTGAQGNIKVYRNWDQGIQATVATLRNGRYGGIISALKAGDPAAVASAIGQTPWGTSGDLVQRTIMGTTAPSVPSKTYLGSPASVGKVTPPKLDMGGSTVDTKGAVVAALLDPRKKMSLASRIVGNVSSGAYTTTTAPKVTPGKVYGVTSAAKPAASPTSASGLHGSKVLELIHNDGGKGYGIKNGQVVDGASVFSAVWAGHANHVHVAAGPKTIVELGKLAQHMGLHVSENPHFGGVTQGAHVADSYHYKGEAIDVSGDAAKMNAYARAVAAYNRAH